MNELTVPHEAPETMESPSTALPKKRDLVINRPGNINYAGERGHFPGCRLLEFTGYGEVKGLEAADAAKFEVQRAEAGLSDKQANASELVNLYFKHRGNMLTVAYDVDASGAVWVLATNQLEGDELEAFHHIAQMTTQWMDEWREKKEHEKERANEHARKNLHEQAELIPLGKKERDGNFVERARKAEDENEKLRKENAKLRAAEKKGKK